MSLAKLTLIGLYKYDNDLFNNLSFNGVDSETLINNILLQGGEFEVLYPSVEITKTMILHFVSKWSRTVNKWVNALNLEYNPIENYDRYENYSGNEVENESGCEVTHKNGNEIIKNSGNTELQKTGTDRNENEEKTSAFNSSDYQPDNSSNTSVTYGSNNKNIVNLSETRTPNLIETRTPHITRTRTPNLTNHIHGNIGVLTNQKMIESELTLQEWNIYEHITDLFLNEFCIMVY